MTASDSDVMATPSSDDSRHQIRQGAARQRRGDNPAPAKDNRREPSHSPEGSTGETSGEDDPDEEAEGPAKQPVPRWRKVLYVAIGLAVAAAVVVGATLYYLSARQYESTDDAFVDGYISQVSAQVSGRILHLAFQDNDDVRAGQFLVEIDPRDLQIRLSQARAQRANIAAQVTQIEAQIGLQQANIDQAIANSRVAEADLAKSRQDLERYRSVNPGSIAKQQVDDAASSTRSSSAKLDANRQAVAAARAQLQAAHAQFQGAQAQLAAADSDVANAELQLSYTHVVAPVAGQVTKRSVAVGNYVTPGLALLSIVPREVWITANFKENQIGQMHVGQPVDISIDQYPDLKFRGRVDSFQNGTGSAFSTLPAENATGNYVKVVQRLPVKITFDQHPPGAPDDLRLSPGLSVSPRVKVR